MRVQYSGLYSRLYLDEKIRKAQDEAMAEIYAARLCGKNLIRPEGRAFK